MTWTVSVRLIAEWGESMAESEGDLAEETQSVERVWKRICEVLCSRPVSADNRTKHNVDRAMSPKYWMYKGRLISCELFLKFCVSSCFNCLNCSVNKQCYLLNPRAYLLQYITIPLKKRAFGHAATSITWHQNISSCISLMISQQQMYQPQTSTTILDVDHTLI